MRFLFFRLSFVWIFLVVLISQNVLAAEIFIKPLTGDVAIGEQFTVELILNTESEEINALEGEIVFPDNLLEVKEIIDSESIINFWIKRPQEDSLVFSGIVPGGYNGDFGNIFSVVFESKKRGEVSFDLKKSVVLLNDGQATEAKLTFLPYNFEISGEKSLKDPLIKKVQDNNPPEPFDPIIAKDPDVFDGKYFLVFATQDKISGISHYEVKEGDRKFKKQQSPYLLKNQDLDEAVVVRAIDKAGNMRDSYYAGLNKADSGQEQEDDLFYTKILFGMALLAIAIVLGLLLRNLRSRRARR